MTKTAFEAIESGSLFDEPHGQMMYEIGAQVTDPETQQHGKNYHVITCTAGIIVLNVFI